MTHKRTAVAVLCTVVVLALLAFSLAHSPVNLSEQDKVVVELQNRLGFDILKELTHQHGNVLISPTSVALALSMVYNGAEAETKEAIAQTLGVSDLTIQEFNEASENIVRLLNHADPDVQLSVANAIWGREGIDFQEAFLGSCEKHFDAEVDTLNFTSPEALETINNWASKKTKGKIRKILETIDPLDIMFLTNAVYFKGAWTIRFDRKLTEEREFTLGDGTQKMVPMMRWKRAEELGYLEDQEFWAVHLPYGGRERIGMYIFLPRNLTAFVQDLSVSKWNGWMDQFDTTKGIVILPRFTVKYQERLNDVLSNLGMGIAFQEDRANFSGIVDLADLPTGLFIAYVTHKTFIEVNEQGTEAAGGTLFAARTKWTPPMFRVDRPFFFVIRDSQSGAILFMGFVEYPIQ